ncbi:MAG: hypothetical protein H7335_17265 [Massilia sp.]|nr:hypothetical protein [Massilia sp.]
MPTYPHALFATDYTAAVGDGQATHLTNETPVAEELTLDDGLHSNA